MSVNDSIPTVDEYLDKVEATAEYNELLLVCLKALSYCKTSVCVRGYGYYVVAAIMRAFRRKGFVVTKSTDPENCVKDYLHFLCD